MSGTREGGIKTAITNKQKHGDDFYIKLGKSGGSVRGVKKGFAANIELAKIAGAKGGSISRKGNK
jgi:general stress protein YciG